MKQADECTQDLFIMRLLCVLRERTDTS